MEAHEGTLIIDLALVTGVAAVTAMIARRLGQPSILGYLLAGLIVGPYIPIPLFADPERMAALAEVGVVLVMFAVGLEFRIRRLAEILPVSGLTAIVQIGALAWAGHTVGSVLGWSSAASISLGATLAISSTMVVSAVLRAQPVDADVRAHVFGILVVQDLVAIVLMAVVTTLASGQELGLQSIGRLVGELGVVVLGMLVLGLLVLPRLVRLAIRRFDSEVLVVLVVGAAFGLASVAELFGYSVALGAFIAGMAVAESGRGEQVEHAIESLRSLFAAIFFVSIGMTVDPTMAWQSMPLALGLSAVVIAAQFVSVTSASMLTGSSLRRSVFSGLALGQIGELSFILATIGIGGGVLPEETLPALVTVATVTAFTTPFLLGRAQLVVDGLDRLIPDRVQDFLSAYQTFARRSRGDSDERPLRRSVVAVLLDWTVLLLIYVTHHALGRSLAANHLIILSVGAVLLAAPFLVGLVRSGRRMASQARELARGDGSNDGPWARAVEAVALLTVVLSVGVPTVAIVQPLLAGPWAQALVVAALVVVLVLVGLRFRAVKPGYTSEVAQLAFRLADQLGPAAGDTGQAPHFDPLSGLDYEPLPVEASSGACGSTLAELNLRCKTGATVVAISRGDASVPFPTGHERLQAGDLVALSGSDDALERARALLAAPADSSAPPAAALSEAAT
ncbi:Inner membrane protein YbaL [Enhygromyxa salina]|uniref:Inner membrane protein YbaL n=1 Tax=Enhygromyxa salina TaxID=215803 RepID=A0A2S9YD84_9BACT|nr:cation:proton antiporter [Enhygromyxa salina]PRQ03063.1 Inner membrane protein YbaL [Enhygromyxa salina]